MATETILMAGAQAGGDRQILHERIRQHSHAASDRVKHHGEENDLIARLRNDPAFANLQWEAVLDAKQYVGRAPQQVDEFLAETVRPLLDADRSQPPTDINVEV
jgi:adenylosuccinate lyase